MHEASLSMSGHIHEASLSSLLDEVVSWPIPLTDSASWPSGLTTVGGSWR